MKYITTVEIDLPREKVTELFGDPNSLANWYPQLTNIERLSGTPGESGAKSNLSFKMGKKEIVLLETIIKNELPKTFLVAYDTNGVHNIIENFFEETGDSTTNWKAVNEFQFSGIKKLMGWLMPGAFRKQTLKNMKLFKSYAQEKYKS